MTATDTYVHPEYLTGLIGLRRIQNIPRWRSWTAMTPTPRS